MFEKLFKIIKEEDLKIIYKNNMLDIINYKKILIFSLEKIKIETNKYYIVIQGKNLTIRKMYDDEILIIGNIEILKWDKIYE